MELGEILDSFALNLSRVFHPFLISVPAGLLFLYLSDLSIFDSVKWITLSTSLTIVPTAFHEVSPDLPSQRYKFKRK